MVERNADRRIMGNLTGLFDSVNEQVSEIATTVGTTPQGWNAGVFSMIQSLSETVIVPIAGIILTFVMTYELIQMIIDRNNMHDFETFMFFKWIFKTFVAVTIVTNTWNIVMAVFDVAQHVVNNAAGVIVSNTDMDLSSVVTNMEARLMEMEIGPLFSLWFQSLLVGIISWVLTICIFVIVYGRMIEIYLVTSIAPIPMATMSNREWGQMGQKLSAQPVRSGLPGVSHHHLRGGVRGTGADYFRRYGCDQGHLDVHRLHGVAMLHAV